MVYKFTGCIFVLGIYKNGFRRGIETKNETTALLNIRGNGMSCLNIPRVFIKIVSLT